MSEPMVLIPRRLAEDLLTEACNQNWSDLNRLLNAPTACRECMGTGGIGRLETCEHCKGAGKVAAPIIANHSEEPLGVVEPISDADLFTMADKAFGQVVDYDLRGGPITDYKILTIGAYGPAIRRLVALARQYPVSPPAPVAVALPERKDTVQMDGYQSPWDAGWNACLDKVKELNQ